MVKSVPRRRQEDRTRTTAAALLGAAEALFGRHGYAATSLDDIAARAGVTKGALYHHFPTGKAVLFEAVILRVHARMTAALEAAAEDALGLAGLKRVLDAYFRFAAEPDIHRMTLLDAPAVLGPEKWRAIEHRHALRHIRQSVDLVLDGIKATQARKAMLAQAFFGAAYEATFVVASAPDRDAARSLAVDTIAAIVEGAYTVLLRQNMDSSPPLKSLKTARSRPPRRG